MWASSGYEAKHKLQYLVFPEGILYNKKKDESRTIRINSIFSAIARLARGLEEKKNGLNKISLEKSALVDRTGQKSNLLIKDVQAILGF